MGGHHDMRTAVLALAITLAPIPPAATSVEEEGGETSAREFERELRRLACEFHVDCLGLKPMEECLGQPPADRLGCRFDPAAAQECLALWDGARCPDEVLEAPQYWHARWEEVFGTEDNPCAAVFFGCPDWWYADPELTLAPSSSREPLPEGVGMAITRTGIYVGEDLVVDLVETDSGRVVPEQSKKGALIVGLYDELQEVRDDLRDVLERRPDDPVYRVTVAADRSTPTRLMVEILYTVGQAGFTRYLFPVAGETGEATGGFPVGVVELRLPRIEPPGVREAPPESFEAAVYISGSGYEVAAMDLGSPMLDLLTGEPSVPTWTVPKSFRRSLPCPDGRCASSAAYDHSGLRDHLAAIQGGSPACEQAVLVPDPGIPWEVVVAAMDAIREVPGGGDSEPRILFPTPILGQPG